MKGDIIANILKRVNTMHVSISLVETLKNFISKPGYESNGELHVFYKTWFNLIDIGDKYWYLAVDHHINQNWKSKMLLSIMHHFMTNVWILSLFQNDTMWIDFRAKLATALVD